MAEHTDLTKLCRICGNILNGRVSYLVKENLSGLQSAFQEALSKMLTKYIHQNFVINVTAQCKIVICRAQKQQNAQ